MRHVSMSKDGRLMLVVENAAPLKAAAAAIRGCRTEGQDDGLAVFSFPALPDVWSDLQLAFSPALDEDARRVTDQLQTAAQAILLANERKGLTGDLVFDGHLRTAPMAHQVEAANFCWSMFQAGVKGSALLMEQGTGKSLVTIALANALHQADLIDYILVLCPNSLKGTWGARDGQVMEHSSLAHHMTILRGNRPKRLDQVTEALTLDPANPSWIVTNYEQLAQDHLRTTHLAELKERLAHRRGLLVCDESTMVKNPDAKRTGSVLALSTAMAYRQILTGTPITKNPMDAFAQFEILENGALGFASYIGFEKHHAVYTRQTVGYGRSKRTFRAVTGFRNLDELREKVATRSYRVRAADCLDLPPVTVQRIPVEVAPVQDKALRSLREEMMAALDEGVVDGRNILTRYLRMAQILGGHVNTLNPDGTPGPRVAFDPNPKMEAASEYLQLALEDPTAKAVVFAQFKPELHSLVALGEKLGWNPGAIHGDVKEADRDLARQRFQNDPDSRLMVCQYQAGSKGLTLTAANIVMFYSLTFSLEDYLQARKRAHRIGQERPVREVYLIASHPEVRGKRRQTLDQVMLRALDGKRELADLVTGDAGREMLEAL